MGGRTYVDTFLSEIQRDSRGLNWVIGLSADLASELRDGVDHPNIRWILFPSWSSSSIGRLLFEQLRLPSIIRTLKPDVVYFSGNLLTLLTASPSVLAIRSLVDSHQPGEVSKLRLLLRRRLAHASARKASCIICPSEYLAKEVSHLFAVPTDRVRTVRHGTSPHYRQKKKDESVLDRLGIRDTPFFVYPAALWGYKNHVTLARAAARLKGPAKKVAIVFAGRGVAVKRRDLESLRLEIEKVPAPARIILSGELEPKELCAIYSSAIATLLPSTCETFGNPIAESMAMACPIVASNSFALPEIVGDAGLLLDPFDVEAWAREISRLALEPEYRESWSQKAAERSSLYTAERAIDELVAALRDTADKARSPE